MLQKLRSGDIDFIITSTANASTVAPQAGVFSLHFIFRDEDHLAKAARRPGVVDGVQAMIAESVQGAHALALITLGFRNIYGKTEFAKVDDMKGKKIRVQATKTEDTHFPAYGAQTVHMPFGEVYTTLQTGVVDSPRTASTSTCPTSTTRWRRCSTHPARSQQQLVWVSDKTWKSFSDEEKQWVETAAAEVGKLEPPHALEAREGVGEKLQSWA